MRIQICEIILLIVLFSNMNLSAGEIHQAASKGDVPQIKSILKTRPEFLNQKDAKGFTPIHSATTKGNIEVIRYLINAGANCNIKNNNGLAPIFTALDRGRSSCAILLIDSGADIEVKGFRNRTLLHMAARGNDILVVGSLISKGADINALDSKKYTPLDLAISTGKTDVAFLLLDKGAKINAFNFEEEFTQRVLRQAAQQGKTEVLEVMIQAGINLVQYEYEGVNLLHSASAYGNIDIVRLMLEQYININKETPSGKSALELAALHGHEDVYNLLLENNAQKKENTMVNFGFSPMLDVSINNNEAYIWYLNHSGWAIKTKNHFLVFDYTELGKKPGVGLISGGFINPDEIKNLRVTVFITHGHNDHFDPRVFDWEKKVRNIQYVLGFNPKGIPQSKYKLLSPHDEKNLNGLGIKTIKSTDSGVAYYVEVDGLHVYHGGDNANKQNKKYGLYHEEIDYLATQVDRVDLLFLLAGSACGGGYAACVLEGDYYAIEKFSPKVVFPMHAGGNEYVYKKFEHEIRQKGMDIPMATAEFQGECFHYKEGSIEDIILSLRK